MGLTTFSLCTNSPVKRYFYQEVYYQTAGIMYFNIIINKYCHNLCVYRTLIFFCVSGMGGGGG